MSNKEESIISHAIYESLIVTYIYAILKMLIQSQINHPRTAKSRLALKPKPAE